MKLSQIWVAIKGEKEFALFPRQKATFVYFSKKKKPIQDLCTAFTKTGKPGFIPVFVDSERLKKSLQGEVTVNPPYQNCSTIGLVELVSCLPEPVNGQVGTTISGEAILV